MMNGSDFSENLQRCHDYIKALEVERRKIQVFGRELPLSFQLITQAIETCKQQLAFGTIASYHNLQGQLSECSEQTSPNVPFFEEFIPMKKASSDFDVEEHNSKNETGKDENKVNDKYCKKSDWLRCVQLWSQTPDPDPPSKEDSIKENKSVVCDAITAAPPPQGPVNMAPPPPQETGGGKKKDEKRKSRRSWSPDLHRRFLQALRQLGGSHLATPKQIRELMKVEGLSNDEVKSHLQKYRLHNRKPSTIINPTTPTSQHQFVVVGGIWVPSEYSKTTTTTEGTSIAALPPPPSPTQRQHVEPSSQSDERGSNSRGATQFCSPATSSSTHTTTISPAC